ncbi:MAG TPA: ABC transporter permease subunit [Nitrospinaceae bacterium]|jgi:ABC-2 type transport system permease protein|nr:ABC transporter permease subunit [Nitrospinaceae bacterium]HJN99236.1 ABC transporter permease subunit [Nitrospinaceae bacterium]|tara:strand:+ start:2611 stop:3378 length:768 start_codon:yes stop_codon:yes gene_type:complete
MKNVWIVAKRDLGSFFNSPVFYCVTTVFLILYGFIFFNILSYFSFQSFQSHQLRGANIGLNLNEMVIEPSFQNMAVILLLIIPLITMRSFSEEKKSKTFALLLSSPIHLEEIILGKFLACMIVTGLMIFLSGYSTGYLIFAGQPETGPILTGYLGILLMTGCYVAMGLFASSLTDNQIIAAVTSFGLALFMWVIGWGAQSAGPVLGQVFEYLSLITHLEHFLKGLIDSSDLVYYFSFILFGLFLTQRVLESSRWR